MTLRIISSLSTVALLAACGGGGTGDDETSFGSITQTAGKSFSVSETAVDARRIGVPLTNGRTATIGVTADSDLDQAAFDGFSGGDHILFEAKSENGTVSVFAHVDATDAAYYPGASAKSSGGTIPNTGVATYTGEYVGFLTRDETTTFPSLTQSYIVGDVSIRANFDTSSVNGDITNRERYSTESKTFSAPMRDVSLTTLSVADGASTFNGRTIGGGLDEDRYPPDGTITGEWSIAFGGDGAAEAGGTILIDHDYLNIATAPDDYIETGGFVASKD